MILPSSCLSGSSSAGSQRLVQDKNMLHSVMQGELRAILVFNIAGTLL